VATFRRSGKKFINQLGRLFPIDREEIISIWVSALGAETIDANAICNVTENKSDGYQAWGLVFMAKYGYANNNAECA